MEPYQVLQRLFTSNHTRALNWSILLNGKDGIGYIFNELDNFMLNVFPQITTWPEHDLFDNTTEIQTAVQNNIKFYPNPTNGIINFNNAVDVRITNITGKEIANEKNTKTINISSAPAGIYFIQTTDYNNTNIQSSKIIKY
jgi:hypothetical protein